MRLPHVVSQRIVSDVKHVKHVVLVGNLFDLLPGQWLLQLPGFLIVAQEPGLDWLDRDLVILNFDHDLIARLDGEVLSNLGWQSNLSFRTDAAKVVLGRHVIPPNDVQHLIRCCTTGVSIRQYVLDRELETLGQAVQPLEKAAAVRVALDHGLR
jgi:hypothetical protein